MAILDILHYPDERLHKIAQPVVAVDERIQQLVKDMAETMYDAPGIGSAATQVDVHEQVVVIDLSESKDQLQVFINAKITKRDGDTVYEEGCLSVPGIFDKVHRSETVTVEALNEKGVQSIFVGTSKLSGCGNSIQEAVIQAMEKEKAIG